MIGESAPLRGVTWNLPHVGFNNLGLDQSIFGSLLRSPEGAEKI